MKPRVALIGPGRVGCAVTRRLYSANYPVAAVIGRNLDRASDGCSFIGCSREKAGTAIEAIKDVELILLAVPDDQIAPLAKEVAQRIALATDQVLIHFSGLLPAAAMRTENATFATLSIHPLLPFADRGMAYEHLTGCPCALEGDAKQLSLGKELIASLGGMPFSIPSEKKALYHASACVASNFLVTILAESSELLAECGIEPQEALPLLRSLVQGSIDNAFSLGPEQGLTGPIVRGDTGTVTAHLAALSKVPEEHLQIYQKLGQATIKLAQRSNRLSPAKAEQLHHIIAAASIN